MKGPPAGEPFTLPELVEIARLDDPAARLGSMLEECLAGRRTVGGAPPRIVLARSGREALRRAFEEAQRETGREEIVVPAYTCYSVPAAAVAAGLRVRLVDVGAEGRIDPESLAALPLERAALVVVCNLFGLAEPVEGIVARTRAAGARILDDAAQSLGASWPGEGRVGGRGLPAVLSFGRGKPLQGLGGGAWIQPPDEARSAGGTSPVVSGAPAAAGARLAGLVRAVGWNLALWPPVFAALRRIPGLGIGETRFDPAFEHGGIDAAALRLAAVQSRAFEARRAGRARRAHALGARILETSAFRPLLAPAEEQGSYPRLAVLAPDPKLRDEALAALAVVGVGASPLYPRSLDAVDALSPHRTDSAPCSGARALAARVLTLPTHGGLDDRRRDAAVSVLSRLAAGA